jgi:hypothetical protein
MGRPSVPAQDNIYCINNFQAILFFRCSASLSENFREKGEGGKPSKLANDGWLLGSRAELPAVPHDSTMVSGGSLALRSSWGNLGERVGGMDSPLNYLLVLVGALDRGFLIW